MKINWIRLFVCLLIFWLILMTFLVIGHPIAGLVIGAVSAYLYVSEFPVFEVKK